MAQVTGPSSTTNVLSGQLAIDLGKEISLLEPDVQPLAVFSRAVKKERTVNPKFKWQEDESKPRFDTTSSTATSSITTVPVTNPSYYEQWDLVLNTRTGEVFRVDAVGTELGVTRAIGSTGTAMLSGDELLIVGSAQPEGDTSRPARTRNPTQSENYTQIVRTPFEVTGSIQASGFQTSPNEWGRVTRNALIEHAKTLEYTYLLGRRSATFPGPFETRTTGGALSFITSNQTDAGGNLSEAEFNAACAQGFRFGKKSKLGLASATAVSALEKFPASKQITKQDESTYGVKVTGFQSLFGTLNLVYHPLLEGQKYGGYLIGLDMDEAWYRFLANDEVSRDTKVLTGRQANDADTNKSEALTESGLRFGQQKKHFLLTGITS